MLVYRKLLGGGKLVFVKLALEQKKHRPKAMFLNETNFKLLYSNLKLSNNVYRSSVSCT